MNRVKITQNTIILSIKIKGSSLSTEDIFKLTIQNLQCLEDIIGIKYLILWGFFSPQDTSVLLQNKTVIKS